MKLRKSSQTLLVLAEFLQSPRNWRYGYDISKNTGLKSGTLYPILMRLAERELLQTCWEAVEEGRPPRHMYRLTSGGLQYAHQEAASIRARSRVQPAFGDARS